MKHTLRVAALLAGLAFAVSGAPAWAQTTSFTDTYKGGSTSTCGFNYSIDGKEPSAAGTYPVFIHLAGTAEGYLAAHPLAARDGMASRGYVSATIEYPNQTFGSCATLGARSRCIFDQASANSAVAKLCSRAKADCSKGIVVSGFSQGSVVGTLANNYDSRIRAVYGQGIGVQYASVDLRSCMLDGAHTLPSDRLRAVSGEVDANLGGTQSAVRGQEQELTGLTCTPTSTSCYRANGSGWRLPLNSEVSDGKADHCYMHNSKCAGSLDSQWSTGPGEWGLNYNLDWLTGFTD
jgi:hypothetical protein